MRCEAATRVLHTLDGDERSGDADLIGVDADANEALLWIDVHGDRWGMGPGHRALFVLRGRSSGAERIASAPIWGMSQEDPPDCEEPTDLGRRAAGNLPLGCFGPQRDLPADLLRLGRLVARFGDEPEMYGGSRTAVLPAPADSLWPGSSTGIFLAPDRRTAWEPRELGLYRIDLRRGAVDAVGVPGAQAVAGFDISPHSGRYLVHRGADLFVGRVQSDDAPGPVELARAAPDGRVDRIDSAVWIDEDRILATVAAASEQGAASGVWLVSIHVDEPTRSHPVAALGGGSALVRRTPDGRHAVAIRFSSGRQHEQWGDPGLWAFDAQTLAVTGHARLRGSALGALLENGPTLILRGLSPQQGRGYRSELAVLALDGQDARALPCAGLDGTVARLRRGPRPDTVFALVLRDEADRPRYEVVEIRLRFGEDVAGAAAAGAPRSR